jgi:NADPH:quinone reductase-like Zn-dependent oxidoreductase
MVIRSLPEDVPGPQSIGRGPRTERRTVLLTGASGVVGRALLQRLRDLDVVCLVKP